jgi:NAD(P)-dependent dehydrogenase (short-subunit alcohol dehydrogenase family)
VDILINNAGLTFHPFAKTEDDFETHLQVNYLSHFLLTHLLMPLLKRSKQGRVINVAAHAYMTARMNVDDPLGISNLAPQFHPRDAFAHSKLAVVVSSRKLAEKLKATAVTVNCITPGLVRGTKHMRRSLVMRAFFAKLIMFPWMWIFMKSPAQGAQSAIFAATGKYFK